MPSTTIVLATLLASCVLAAPTSHSTANFANIPASYLAGFKNPSIQSSVGGQAICVSGTVDVAASGQNLQINYQEPTNSRVLTELVVEIFQTNSTTAQQLVRGQTLVNGTYGIYSQLCFPSTTSTINATTVQFLIHGSGFDRSYWDVAPGYSTAPVDFDAAVLTGFSTDDSGTPIAFSAIDLTIASQILPLRFSGLSNGYMTSSAIAGNQFFFFREPGFDPALLNIAEATKQTLTIGELLSTSHKVALNFTGPIDVVNGANDMPNCYGNCLLPYNKVASVKDAFYPNASNASWYLAPNSGLGLNFHYGALGAYEHIQDFIKTSGF